MKNFETTWNQEELKAYLLLHAAQADYEETSAEHQLILSKVDQATYNHIQHEIAGDNDYQRIQKILSTVKRLGYSKENCEELVKEVLDLFKSDGEYDILERNMMIGLKKLL